MGAPEELNYPAMIISTFIRYVERIPTIKDLVKRLHDDTAAADATHFEARDQAPLKEEKPKPEPKNVDANPRKNVNNGLENKLNGKPTYLFMKRKLKLN